MVERELLSLSAPLIQQHELTSKCNNLCGFCYNPERCQETFTPRESDRERNLEIARASVKAGVMAVCLTGGEPLLVGEHFWDVYNIYKDAGCYVSINSNGRLVTDEIADRLAGRELNSALVSIHGVGKLHNQMVGDDAYDETLAGILRLAERGISVTPNFVATAKNVHALRSVGQMLASHAMKSMTATPFLPSFGAESHKDYVLGQQHYQEYFEAIRHIRELGVKIDSTLPIPPCVLMHYFPETWQEYLNVHSPRVCMAGKSFGVVSPDGLFRACIQAPYLDKFGGPINDYTVSWQHASNWADKKLIPDECHDCKAIGICGGGCRTGCMWDNNGSVKGSTMYMGEPLDEKAAELFIDRIGSDLSVTELEVSYDGWCKNIPNFVFKFKPEVKIREEGNYRIIFNTANQSFTILNCGQGYTTNDILATNSPKVASLLMEMDAIVRLSSDEEWGYFGDKPVSADNFLPRLGKDLNNPEKIYCLRADTGERYFF